MEGKNRPFYNSKKNTQHNLVRKKKKGFQKRGKRGGGLQKRRLGGAEYLQSI